MGKGPKLNTPSTFDGSKENVNAFIRECKIYMMGRSGEFGSEGHKIAFIMSYCRGPGVNGWMDYMTKSVDNGTGPRTGNELLDYMRAYYGDPDEKTTSRTELDKLVQKGRVEEYVIQFQSIAYKTGYSEAELEHRFIVGLNRSIRERCYASYPAPRDLAEWITRAYALQHAWDINDTINQQTQSYPSTWRQRGRFNPRTQGNYTRYPSTSIGTITS
jgi:hypothetical protein